MSFHCFFALEYPYYEFCLKDSSLWVNPSFFFFFERGIYDDGMICISFKRADYDKKAERGMCV